MPGCAADAFYGAGQRFARASSATQAVWRPSEQSRRRAFPRMGTAGPRPCRDPARSPKNRTVLQNRLPCAGSVPIRPLPPARRMAKMGGTLSRLLPAPRAVQGVQHPVPHNRQAGNHRVEAPHRRRCRRSAPRSPYRVLRRDYESPFRPAAAPGPPEALHSGADGVVLAGGEPHGVPPY